MIAMYTDPGTIPLDPMKKSSGYVLLVIIIGMRKYVYVVKGADVRNAPREVIVLFISRLFNVSLRNFLLRIMVMHVI